MQRWMNVYQGCLDKVFGNSSGNAPSREAASAILTVAAIENIAPTLLAVTWAGESGFNFYPDSTPNDGSEGNADVGPVQINYRTWHDSPLLNGLGNVFGTTTTGREQFNGDPMANLRMGARILNGHGSGRHRLCSVRTHPYHQPCPLMAGSRLQQSSKRQLLQCLRR
jgi:hypothetical protein